MKWIVGFFLSFMFSLAASAQTQLQSLLNDKLYLHVKIDSSQKMIEADQLKKLYVLNNYNFLWVQNGRINGSASALKDILLKADDWGLTASHYMTPDLLSLFLRVTDKNAITLEMLLSDVYLRFAQDLANGQLLDPDLIDEDIKMPRKNFVDMKILLEAAVRPGQMPALLKQITPQHEKYKNLANALVKLRVLEAQKAWGDLVDPNGDLKPGNSHKTIPEIKKRLNDLGYPVSNQTPTYDDEMLKAVTRYQELNSIAVGKTISRAFFKSITPNLTDRINQIKANLEKFRWFPKTWENRYMFVNMAMQEMKILEGSRIALEMKTVNGRATRRTPTMRDEARIVELNPTWTVPWSIAVKDKLPLLQENPYALDELNIRLYDNNGNQLNPASVNWLNVDKTNYNYILVQQPGPQNALGLVKFPLTNPWAIYLHDTSEPWLMKETDRQRSSGCVRLERPFDLALYLLKDQPQWTMANMKAQAEEQYRIRVKQPLPVYFMYQTVEVSSSGEIRTAVDQYGQDERLIELFSSRGSREKF